MEDDGEAGRSPGAVRYGKKVFRYHEEPAEYLGFRMSSLGMGVSDKEMRVDFALIRRGKGGGFSYEARENIFAGLVDVSPHVSPEFRIKDGYELGVDAGELASLMQGLRNEMKPVYATDATMVTSGKDPLDAEFERLAKLVRTGSKKTSMDEASANES